MTLQGTSRFVHAVFGLLGLAAVITNWVVNFKPDVDLGRRLADFLSYFTIQTNIVSSLYLLIRAWRGGQTWFGEKPAVRSTILAANAIMLVVYWTLLFPRGFNPAPLALASNIVMHGVMPLALWIMFAFERPQKSLSWLVLVQVLAFPFVFALYSWIRGAALGWYPYFFLDPAKVGGIGGVVLWFVILLAAFVAAGLLVRLVHQVRRIKPTENQSLTAESDQS